METCCSGLRARRPGRPDAVPRADDVLVLASGNLGLVYLTRARRSGSPGSGSTSSTRGCCRPCCEHPGIGFLLVALRGPGAPRPVPGASSSFAPGKVAGTDPLAAFGPHARTQVRGPTRTRTAPDIMVNSLWDEQTGEVAAFEELVGSHGGLGGDQTRPFLLYPADLPDPVGEISAPRRCTGSCAAGWRTSATWPRQSDLIVPGGTTLPVVLQGGPCHADPHPHPPGRPGCGDLPHGLAPPRRRHHRRGLRLSLDRAALRPRQRHARTDPAPAGAAA